MGKERGEIKDVLVFTVLIILFLLFVIFIVLSHNVGNIRDGLSGFLYNIRWNKMEKATEFITTEYVEKKISDHLQEKYNEEFDIKHFRTGFKRKYKVHIDVTPVYSGDDYNVKEYVYSFSPIKDKKEGYYIAYRYDIKEKKEEIQEITDGRAIYLKSNDVSYYADYKKDVKYQKEIDKISDKLTKYINDNEEYDVDIQYIYEITIDINSNKNLENKLETDKNEFIELYNILFGIINEYDVEEIYLKYQDDSICIKPENYIYLSYNGKNITLRNINEVISYVENNKK